MQSSSNSHEASSNDSLTNENVSSTSFTDEQLLKSSKGKQRFPVINCIMTDKIVFHTG